MKIFFLISFINFIKSSILDSIKKTGELKDIAYVSSLALRYSSGLILIYKEFEDKNIEDIEFNNEDPELDLILKNFFIINKTIQKIGCFSNFDEFQDLFVQMYEKLRFMIKSTVSNENFNTYIKLVNNFGEKYNFENLSVEEYKKIFYISSYLKNMNIEKVRSYWNNDEKRFSFIEFVDNLELDDEELIEDLKSFKLKNNELSSSINLDEIFGKSAKDNINIFGEILEKSAQDYIKILDEYFKQKKNEKYKENIYLIKNILIILLIIFIIIGSIIYIRKNN